MIDPGILTHFLASGRPRLFAAGTLPSGFAHNPTSVTGAVSGISGAVKTVSDAVPALAGAGGGGIAGYHAVAKAASTDPQVIQKHHSGMKNGIIGGLVGIGAGSIITILAHIL